MAVLNPSFEDAGASPGQAANWTVASTVTTFEIASFDTGGYIGWEDFESDWSNTPFYSEFGAGALEVAEFESTTTIPNEVEDFEQLWSNLPYLTELSVIDAATFDGNDFENFEAAGWDPNYKTAFSGGDIDAAVFDGNDYENFEAAGWDPNYKTVFSGGDLSNAEFTEWNNTTNLYINVDYERFEKAVHVRAFSVDPATDILTLNGTHPFSSPATPPIKLERVGSGNLPTPLNEADTYYANVQTSVSIKLQLAPGASPVVDITDRGTGTHNVIPDLKAYWYYMETV
jgi:hypothetical protein